MATRHLYKDLFAKWRVVSSQEECGTFSPLPPQIDFVPVLCGGGGRGLRRGGMNGRRRCLQQQHIAATHELQKPFMASNSIVLLQET